MYDKTESHAKLIKKLLQFFFCGNTHSQHVSKVRFKKFFFMNMIND